VLGMRVSRKSQCLAKQELLVATSELKVFAQESLLKNIWVWPGRRLCVCVCVVQEFGVAR
jgi:hypothetical protein